MIDSTSLHVPFAELPVETRVLFFLYASAAMARFGVHPPTPSDLSPQLEAFWNQHGLRCEDVSDPDRLTALLKEHFVPLIGVLPNHGTDGRTRCRKAHRSAD